MKLTDEERMDLEEMLSSDGMKALWKVAEECCERIEREVLQCTLEDSPASAHKLMLTKARAEGAARLLLALRRSLNPKAPTTE